MRNVKKDPKLNAKKLKEEITSTVPIVIPRPVAPKDEVAAPASIAEPKTSTLSTTPRLLTLSEEQLEELIKKKVSENHTSSAASSVAFTNSGLPGVMPSNGQDLLSHTNTLPSSSQSMMSLSLSQQPNQLLFGTMQLLLQQQQHEIERLHEANNLKRVQQSCTSGLQMLQLFAMGMKPQI